ncbi:histidine kinase [Erythrobacter sp. SG61-1L]|uniref:sensor histidine kinase n=1 Tax=Erythrobacter sp. SG61-1L TaxID=1603897 RepID=UPI0006D6A769|nr:ATP-binding protein [Erythrobacter sp. SG61-1L]KPL66828.1 histidine kinase [Erythrobacter sp. SG61-1L]
MTAISAHRSIFSRLVLWAIAVSTVVVLLLWLMTYASIERSTVAAQKRAVDVDLAGLVDIYASGGEQELARRINDRLAFVPGDGNRPHYLLVRAGGAHIAGDLQSWPALNARLSERGEVALPGGRSAIARATQLDEDLRLLVARERGDDASLLHAVTLVFLGGGAALIAAVGLLGRYAARRLARRIGRINAAFREPNVQLLDTLTVWPGDADEIGELASRSAAALARLRRLVDAHREMSDQIAHEIRTPLMHLDNRILKVLRTEPNEMVAIGLVEARADIRRIVDMLESLLDIATSEARRGETLGLREVDLSEMVQRLGELYSDSAEESGHRFECEVEQGVTIRGEESQLTRLVTNLLDNAFKYVPAGSAVRLSLRAGPVLTVSDDGPGIPAEERELIFQRFRRGAGQRPERQGSGLGLALARAIAERHGLTIKLADAGVGACFVIRREKA